MQTKEGENFITALNYSEIAKGALGMASFLAAPVILALALDNLNINPLFLFENRYFNFFWSGSIVGFAKALSGARDFKALGPGVAAGTLLYKLGEPIVAGTKPADVYDLTSSGLGILGFIAFDKAAKKLYESGATSPLYRMLRIEDQRNAFKI